MKRSRRLSCRRWLRFFASTVLASAQPFKVDIVTNPSSATSLQAPWAMTPDGKPLLSWIETSKDGASTLRYAIRNGARWSEPRTIVANRRFFRQPAESPSVVSFADGSLLAEWVEIPRGLKRGRVPIRVGIKGRHTVDTARSSPQGPKSGSACTGVHGSERRPGGVCYLAGSAER